MLDHIRLYAKIQSTTALGPGNRFAIWVQGCPFRCKNCIAPNSRDFSGGFSYSIQKLADEVLQAQNVVGVTLSGGEPFSQSEALCELISKIKRYKDFGVIVYTGFTLSNLLGKGQKEHYISQLLDYTDILIDGIYVDSKNNNIALRGSVNQQVLFLTERYVSYRAMYESIGRKVEFCMGEDLMMVGIPSKKQYSVWNAVTNGKTMRYK